MRAMSQSTQPGNLDLSRRSFLGAASLAAAGTAFTTRRASANTTARSAQAKARNCIFMVSDGMSLGTWTLADMAIRRTLGRPSAWSALWSRPGTRRSLCTTHSADSLVTDSAAAGSAWGCGVHINNGAINVSPDGKEQTPILIAARERGFKTGLVTTTTLVDATPASFATNAAKRSMGAQIAQQLVERQIDVLLGGGHELLAPLASKTDKIVFAKTRAELAETASRPGRLIGTFAEGNIPYVLDRSDSIPSLVDMSRAALSRLEQSAAEAKTGFVMQIEGGRVDHCAHGNDAASLVREQMEFDATIAAVTGFINGRDDTLLIVTSDHANANPGLTLYGEDASAAFTRLLSVKHSFEWIHGKVGAIKDPAERATATAAAVLEASGVQLTQSDIDWLTRAEKGERTSGFNAQHSPGACLGAILANYLGVSFVSGNHTADMVEVTALGPGSDALKPVSDNIDLHFMMREALGVTIG
jgi:alkaline phosphatase